MNLLWNEGKSQIAKTDETFEPWNNNNDSDHDNYYDNDDRYKYSPINLHIKIPKSQWHINQESRCTTSNNNDNKNHNYNDNDDR